MMKDVNYIYSVMTPNSTKNVFMRKINFNNNMFNHGSICTGNKLDG